MAHTGWLDEREAALWRALLELARRMQVATERQLLDNGLSVADHALLTPLSETPDGVVRARDLGRAIGWDRSRLAHQLRRMESRGLIAREGCAEDARATMVAITEAGRRAVERAAPGHVATVRAELFLRLDAADVDTLLAISGRLLGRADPACGVWQDGDPDVERGCSAPP